MSKHHLGTVFNNVEELVDIAIVDINPYTDNQYTNLVYNILNETGQYKIGIME